MFQFAVVLSYCRSKFLTTSFLPLYIIIKIPLKFLHDPKYTTGRRASYHQQGETAGMFSHLGDLSVVSFCSKQSVRGSSGELISSLVWCIFRLVSWEATWLALQCPMRLGQYHKTLAGLRDKDKSGDVYLFGCIYAWMIVWWVDRKGEGEGAGPHICQCWKLSHSRKQCKAYWREKYIVRKYTPSRSLVKKINVDSIRAHQPSAKRGNQSRAFLKQVSI